MSLSIANIDLNSCADSDNNARDTILSPIGIPNREEYQAYEELVKSSSCNDSPLCSPIPMKSRLDKVGFLVGTPKRLDLSSRSFRTAPISVQGMKQVWIRLELNQKKQTLVDSCGNGNQNWFQHAVKFDLSAVLEVHPDRIQIDHVMEKGDKTVIEVRLTDSGANSDRLEVSHVAEQLMWQVSRNMFVKNTLGYKSIREMIMKVDVKDRAPRNWSKYLFLGCALLLLSAIHLSMAFSSMPVLGLRPSSSVLRKSKFTQAPIAYHNEKVAMQDRTRRPVGALNMLEPFTITTLLLVGADKVMSKKGSVGKLGLQAEPKERMTRGQAKELRRQVGLTMQTESQDAPTRSLKRSRTLASRTLRSLARYVMKDPVCATDTLIKSATRTLVQRRVMEEEYPAETAVFDDLTENFLNTLDQTSSLVMHGGKIYMKISHVVDLVVNRLTASEIHSLSSLAHYTHFPSGLGHVAVVSGFALAAFLTALVANETPFD
eukprot:763008-Hanusia_phi.AAC.7